MTGSRLRFPRVLLVAVVTTCCSSPAPTDRMSGPAAPPLPPVEGTLAVDGLTAPVRIVRDRWGIPHITAETQDDLFFAQGFVQAQDRLFQMDLWRRAVQGRLSEVLGANFIERDAMTRRVQYRGPLDVEWASYGPDAKAIVTAFTRGVNAWIAMAQDGLPEEFALAGWTPELWQPEDLLTRTEAFLLSRGAADQLFRARLAQAIGQTAARRVLGDAAPVGIAPDIDLRAINPFIGDMIRRVGTPPFFSGLSGSVVGVRPAAAGESAAALESSAPLPLVPRAVDTGSAWSLAPSVTGTDAAIVASVWLSALDQPSARYVVHLKAPGWNVAGVTSPWRPGVVAGHNERIAWSFLVSTRDTQDVVVERLKPGNLKERETPAGWRRLTVLKETVQVKGRPEPFESEAQYASEGPGAAPIVAIDRERHLAYGIAWSGREAGGAAELGALALGRAQSWTGFRAALGAWRMPVATFVYADVDGHIGSQLAGRVPVRHPKQGVWPSAGWLSGRGWRGWVGEAGLPSTVDPPDGRVLAPSSSMARQRRLEALLAATPLVPERVRSAQLDVVSWNAEQLIPLLASVLSDRSDIESARRRLLTWDRRLDVESPDATLFVAWEDTLLTKLAAKRVPVGLIPEFVSRAEAQLVSALIESSTEWFADDRGAERDRCLLDALAAALAELERRTGSEAGVPWSRFQTVTFLHPLAVSPDARRRFGMAPFPLAGYPATVAASYRTTDVTVAPTVRMLFDLADWDHSRVVIAPGQSAAPDSPHFSDMARAWIDGDDVPLVFSDEAVAAAAMSTLVLRPR